MNSGQVLLGVGLGGWGLTFYGVARWNVRDDARLRRTAQSRWKWDRYTTKKLRTGQMSQEEWFDQFARSQRLIVKWAFTPFIVLWLVLCFVTTVHGLSTG